MRREFFAGPNFSGRSAALLTALRDEARPAFFVGPYAEAALSGLSSTVADELTLYRGQSVATAAAIRGLDIANALNRKPQSLSGGEQVLLALQCFAQSAFDNLAVDTALEQARCDNRATALAYLGCAGLQRLADRQSRTSRPAGCAAISHARDTAYAIDWRALTAAVLPQRAEAISIAGLNFAYPNGSRSSSTPSVALEPDRAYRVSGANGAGKTTLLKILVGALVPDGRRDDARRASYRPWRDGNRALALATQNPDQQWCGATLREDMTRRRAALRRAGQAARMDDERLDAIAGALGNVSLDQHLYECRSRRASA